MKRRMMTLRKLLLLCATIAAFTNLRAQFATEEAVYAYLRDNMMELDKVEGVYGCNSYTQAPNGQPIKQPLGAKKVAVVKQNGVISAYWITENTREVNPKPFMTIKKRDYINTYDAQIYDWAPKEIEFLDELNYKVIKDNPKKKSTDGSVESYYLERIYPSQADIDKMLAANPKSATCTGFLISKNYIVTNLRTVEKAKSIKIKGVKGDFANSYTAVLKQSDRNNDLAILSFEDTTIKIPCPIVFSPTPPDAGKEVYVLAYPLTPATGNEVKLTSGMVSSKAGYNGDIGSFQINAPMQPGHIGGPVFDKTGALAGIVRLNKEAGDASSFVVKSGYLKNLMDALPSKIKMPATNALATKPLTEKVKALNKFVYIVEVAY